MVVCLFTEKAGYRWSRIPVCFWDFLAGASSQAQNEVPQGGHRRPAPSRAELDTSFPQCSQVTVLRVPAPPRRVFRRSGQ